MAYISQEEKKVRLPAIKAVAKKFGMKVTVGVKHHSTLVVNVKEGPLTFDDYEQVNVYHIEKFYGTDTKQTAFLDEMIVAMKGVGWFCNDDSQTDYFHRSFYTDINIGQWNKPYIQKGE
jgi:hypothetical protein|tara:strand:- start:7689 stop:8045 length:357 start_codon:yes stop_codon:yes gene_type:complete